MAKNMAPKVYFVAVRNCKRNPYGVFHKDDNRLTYAVREKYGPFTRAEANAFQLPDRYIVIGCKRGGTDKVERFTSMIDAIIFKASIVGGEENIGIFDRATQDYI